MTRRSTLTIILSTLLLKGCASVSMLPKDASEVSFDAAEGKTGWSKYEQVETFRGHSKESVYDAAKVALGGVGFSLRKADLSKGMLAGEHGMTAHDWNIIAGIYLKEEGVATKVKVIIEGSKDIGFSGDVTGDGWAGKILMGMRQYLNETHQAILKVDKADLK